MRALREISEAVLWFEARSCWRFAYRDPFTLERKFVMCVPDKFREFGIPLASPDVVRRPTKLAQDLCCKLRRAFLDGLRQVTPVPSEPAVPLLSEAVEKFHAIGDHRNPGYQATLRAICGEFLDTVGDKSVDRLIDEDLKAYERRISQRVGRVTVRSYLRQLAMFVEYAVRKGWLRSDPRLTFRMPREVIRDPDPFTEDEIARFFEVVRAAVPGHPRGWGYLEWIGTGLLCLGLRPIELQHAKWENVNFDERTIFIAKSHGAKERQARQRQPIPLAAMPAFEARRKRAGCVWTGYFGEQVSDGILHRGRESLQKQFPGFQWKRFRKTFATILAEAGNDIVMISRLLRHSAGGKNISIAQRHYLGRSDNLLRAAVDEAFEPYGALLAPKGAAAVATLRTTRVANGIT